VWRAFFIFLSKMGWEEFFFFFLFWAGGGVATVKPDGQGRRGREWECSKKGPFCHFVRRRSWQFFKHSKPSKFQEGGGGYGGENVNKLLGSVVCICAA